MGSLTVGDILDPVGQHVGVPELGNSQSVELLGSSAEGRTVGRGSYHQTDGTGAQFCPFLPVVPCPHPPLTCWATVLQVCYSLCPCPRDSEAQHSLLFPSHSP